MEKLHSQKDQFIIVLIFLQFCSLLAQSPDYTFPDYYFINCGSDSNATYGDMKVFVGDSSFFSSQNQSIRASSKTPSNNTSLLHQTARVFYGDRSFYDFEIKETGTYIVRLHFFAFSSAEANLSDALFSVRTDKFLLLSNFSISQSSDLLVKEFLLTVPTGIFRIQLKPSRSSFAFVNAIEVFLAPEGFIPDSATHISSAGLISSNFTRLLSRALRVIYRINIGGSKVTAENDTLLREWTPDDKFLLSSVSETMSQLKDVQFSSYYYSSRFIAPENVYGSARVLNTSKNPNVSSIRWGFSVSKNSIYLVRFHFFDILSSQSNSIKFNLHIYSFIKIISPYDLADGLNTPVYLDLIVDSDDTGFINISLGKIVDSPTQNVLLNGLEIMEIFQEQSKRRKHKLFILGGSFGGLCVLTCMTVLFLVVRLRRGKLGLSSGWSDSQFNNMSLPAHLNLDLKISYSEIKRATKRFNNKLVIGRGGFGKVYRGHLRNGDKVAVKRSEPGHGQGFQEFQSEIILLSQIRHRHLVSLIGYCMERSEMILVYEFMEKGTLREHLYDENSEAYSSKAELSWEERLKICIDAAKGLDYLHTGLESKIIHRDIKSTNILLSEDYTAKVADFGLSKSRLPGQEQEMTDNVVRGTFGFIDPESLMTLQFTEKSDVYAFGVVLLEVLCARPAILNNPDRNDEKCLADWGIHMQMQGRLEEIIDPALAGTINASSLKKFGETAEKCLRASRDERPVMRDVLWDLQYALQLQETAGNVQQVEETMLTSTFGFTFQAEDQLPSFSSPVEADDAELEGDHSSLSVATGVFSQLRIDGGR